MNILIQSFLTMIAIIIYLALVLSPIVIGFYIYDHIVDEHPCLGWLLIATYAFIDYWFVVALNMYIYSV
jgi:ABC-type molybdate transport system permease subunit